MRSANLFGPLKGLCPHKALIGLTQASGLAGGFDSAFFGSAPDQDPKAATYAVLIPDPGRFANVRNAPRVMTAPRPKRPCFDVWAVVCGPVGEGDFRL